MIPNCVFASAIRPDSARTILHDREVVLDGEVHAFVGQLRLRAFVQAQVLDLQQNVTRLATTERSMDGFVVRLNQIVDRFLLERKAHDRRHDLEELSEFLLGGINHFDLVRDATQKCVIDEILGFEVCRETRPIGQTGLRSIYRWGESGSRSVFPGVRSSD